MVIENGIQDSADFFHMMNVQSAPVMHARLVTTGFVEGSASRPAFGIPAKNMRERCPRIVVASFSSAELSIGSIFPIERKGESLETPVLLHVISSPIGVGVPANRVYFIENDGEHHILAQCKQGITAGSFLRGERFFPVSLDLSASGGELPRCTSPLRGDGG